MHKPNPEQLIKDGEVVTNQWQLITDMSTSLPTGKILLPLALWQTQQALLAKRDDVGVWLRNDVTLDELAPSLLQLPLIAIEFPVFMDGRGFSLARVLRDRYNYQGELRAIGHIIRDQLCYLQRCGFNSFAFDDSVDVNAALSSLSDFSEAYQTAADQAIPLFRRRA
jgi:uncharacterized protein (DUF934 family)